MIPKEKDTEYSRTIAEYLERICNALGNLEDLLIVYKDLEVDYEKENGIVSVSISRGVFWACIFLSSNLFFIFNTIVKTFTNNESVVISNIIYFVITMFSGWRLSDNIKIYLRKIRKVKIISNLTDKVFTEIESKKVGYKPNAIN